MAYSSDSFRDYAMKVEGETSAVVVTDPVGIRPSDAGSRTEQMLESLLTKVTGLSQGQQNLARGTATALNEIGQRLTSLEQSRPSSRQSGSRRTSRQSSRATSPNPDPYSLSLPSGVVVNPTVLSASAPFVTALNRDLPPTSTLAGEALVSTTVPLRRSARLLSKLRPDYRLAGRSDDWTLVKEPSRVQGPREPQDMVAPRLGCPNKTFFKSSQVSPYGKFPYDQNIPQKNFRSFEQYLKVPKVLGVFMFRH